MFCSIKTLNFADRYNHNNQNWKQDQNCDMKIERNGNNFNGGIRKRNFKTKGQRLYINRENISKECFTRVRVQYKILKKL